MNSSWTQLTIICLHHTRQWWKSSDFHVFGIPWRLPQVRNRSWSGMKRLFFSPECSYKNSCQWRERDSSVRSPWVFVCSDPKLQAHLRRLLRSPLSWELKENLCFVSSAILKWAHFTRVGAQAQSTWKTLKLPLQVPPCFYFGLYPAFFSMWSLLYLVIQRLIWYSWYCFMLMYVFLISL